MNFNLTKLRVACAVATCLGLLAAPPGAAAQDAGRPESGAILLLIGDAQPATAERGAVVRLGPEDTEWTDGDPVLLPVFRPGPAGGRWMRPLGAGTDDATCLTQAVYYESRGEPLAGQQGVAQVVMNRRGRYARDVCAVVFQRSRSTCQFTFACDGAMTRPIDANAWLRARTVAEKALGGFVYAPLKDATHFHATYVSPPWASSTPRLQQIGQHIFYR